MNPIDPVELEWVQIAASRDEDLATERVEPVALEDAMKRLRSQFPG
jgi:hypothetical protein